MHVDSHINRLVLAGYRPRTVSARRSVINAFAGSLQGKALHEAHRLDVEMFLARDLAAETRRSYLNHLRAYYGWLCDEELMTGPNPTAKVAPIRVKKGVPRPIDSEQLVRAIDHAAPRMRAWLLLMAQAGLRCMEVAALRPADLLVQKDGVLLFLRECKGGSTATVPAHPETLEALGVLSISEGCWWDVTPHHVTVQTSRYLKSLGITSGAHSLRHYAGTSFYKTSGHDLLTTARLLRHASVQTSQIYAQLDPTRPAEVVNLLPRLRAV